MTADGESSDTLPMISIIGELFVFRWFAPSRSNDLRCAVPTYAPGSKTNVFLPFGCRRRQASRRLIFRGKEIESGNHRFETSGFHEFHEQGEGPGLPIGYARVATDDWNLLLQRMHDAGRRRFRCRHMMSGSIPHPRSAGRWACRSRHVTTTSAALADGASFSVVELHLGRRRG